MPAGTVTTRPRPPVSITTYAVMTLVMLPIGRLVTDVRLHRSAPLTAFATSAHGARTPVGADVAARAPGAAAARQPATSPVTATALNSRPATRIWHSHRSRRRQTHCLSGPPPLVAIDRRIFAGVSPRSRATK